MLIRNVQVYTDKFCFVPGSVRTEQDKITQVFTDGLIPESKNCEEVLDGAGGLLIPGLVDIHLHGCNGAELSRDPQSLITIARYEASRGITSILPTTMTVAESELIHICKMTDFYCSQPAADHCASIIGLHLEGPFISPSKRGAQKESSIRLPDLALYHRLQEASGHRIRMISMAPELNGAMDFIRQVSGEVVVSVAHTDAGFDTASAAFSAGSSHLTHMFNAMPSLHHRQPGPVAAAALHQNVMPEIICDLQHVHPAMINIAMQLFGEDRLVLISDSMEATGLGDGLFMLGGQEVEVHGRRAVLKGSNTLAGSVTDLMDCMKNLVSIGIPLETAIRCASFNPAKSIGMEHEIGSVSPGFSADLVLMNSDLTIRYVICRGNVLK